MNNELREDIERSKAACRHQNATLLARMTDVTSDVLLTEHERRPELATEPRTAANRLAAICEAVTRPCFTEPNPQIDELKCSSCASGTERGNREHAQEPSDRPAPQRAGGRESDRGRRTRHERPAMPLDPRYPESLGQARRATLESGV